MKNIKPLTDQELKKEIIKTIQDCDVFCGSTDCSECIFRYKENCSILDTFRYASLGCSPHSVLMEDVIKGLELSDLKPKEEKKHYRRLK